MREIAIPHGTIRYSDEGTGRPIVFIHGAQVNGLLWRKVAPALVPDFPAYGVLHQPSVGTLLTCEGSSNIFAVGEADVDASVWTIHPLPPLVLVTALGCVLVVTSPLLSGTRHGFSTRRGGVSTGRYATLNVGGKWGDDPEHVAHNRRRLAAAAGFDWSRLYTAKQVPELSNEAQGKVVGEAARLARHRVVVMEDTPTGRVDLLLNTAWDKVLNWRHGVPTPCTFRTVDEWLPVFMEHGLDAVHVQMYRPKWPTLMSYHHTLFVLDREPE